MCMDVVFNASFKLICIHKLNAAISDSIIQYHKLSYCIIQYHIVSYCIIHIILYQAVLYSSRILKHLKITQYNFYRIG